MAAESEKKPSKKEEIKRQAQEQNIIDGFNQLRQEQRSLTAKLIELEMDLNEHTLVADALQKVDGDRRCYRMIGDVLVERTVKEILPAVVSNKEKMAKAVEGLNQKIVAKGQELNEYREKHNIQIKDGPSGPTRPQPTEKSGSKPATGVLV
ncbi:prefoldin subunit 2-like [Ornithodoros turicata]|uniref:Putative molecular chaperone prefoldin subunit 2 n=1 Tax=Ornithodoros turicata TaxID=34597 RepID=A0A2R5LHH8_9ACAR